MMFAKKKVEWNEECNKEKERESRQVKVINHIICKGLKMMIKGMRGRRDIKVGMIQNLDY
jgi:hypothetical protein